MDRDYTKPNYGRVVLAGILDAAITIALSILILQFLKIKINGTLFVFLIFLLYRIMTIIIYSATPGMRLLGIKYLTEVEDQINFKEKFLASFFILYEGVDYFRKS